MAYQTNAIALTKRHGDFAQCLDDRYAPIDADLAASLTHRYRDENTAGPDDLLLRQRIDHQVRGAALETGA